MFVYLNIYRGASLTAVIVYVILAIHFQRDGAVGTSPSLNAVAAVFAVFQCALSVPRATVLASSWKEIQPKKPNLN